MICDSRLLMDLCPAEWNVEPFQTFAGTLKVGVKAVEESGIAAVRFRVNGGAWTDVTADAWNADGEAFDHFTTLTASDYSDGPITVDAIAIANNGCTELLPPLTLNANSGGTLSVATYYVGGTGADDGNAGTSEAPFATLLGAYQAVYAARSAFGTARMDGVTFKLRAGNWTAPSVNHNNYSDANDYRPVTVTADDGVARDDVVFNATSTNPFGDYQTFNTSIQKLKRITLQVPWYNRVGYDSHLILEDVKQVGSDQQVTDFTHSRFTYTYYINCRGSTMKRAVQSATLARGCRLTDIGESPYHDCPGLVINCGVDGLNDLGSEALHPDVYQHTINPYGAVCDGLIARNINHTTIRMQPAAWDVSVSCLDSDQASGFAFELERPYSHMFLDRIKCAVDGRYTGSINAMNVVWDNADMPAFPTAYAGTEIRTSAAPGITVTPSGGSALDHFDSQDCGSATEGNAVAKSFTIANPGNANLRIGVVKIRDSATDEVSTDWEVTADPSGTIAASGDATLTISLKSTAAVGAHSARVIVFNDASRFFEFTATATVTAADSTAPVLSSPTATVTGTTTATIGVTTDTAEGTLYGVVTTSSTGPSAAQVKAGQDHTGAAAVFADSQAVAASGAKTFSATGLTANTTYYAHFMHEDVVPNASSVSTTAAFVTLPDAPSVLAGEAISATGLTITWTPPDGTITSYTYTYATDAEFSDAVSGGFSAPQTPTYTILGLTPGTTYYIRLTATGPGGTSDVSDTIQVELPSASNPAVLIGAFGYGFGF